VYCTISIQPDLECCYLRYTVTDLTVFMPFGVAGALEEECESQGREKDQHLNGKQRHQLKHRELFLSRQVETLPATHIRGKCSVTLLNETESLLSYLNKDVRFIFCYGTCKCGAED
jgi:metastasis-associated protein MTA